MVEEEWWWKGHLPPTQPTRKTKATGKIADGCQKPGVIGFVHELLDYPKEVENAILLVSRSTLLVENLDVARKNMGGVRMVTIDGSVVDGSGAMTGVILQDRSKIRLFRPHNLPPSP